MLLPVKRRQKSEEGSRKLTEDQVQMRELQSKYKTQPSQVYSGGQRHAIRCRQRGFGVCLFGVFFFCSIDESELEMASGSKQVLSTLTLLSRQLWEHEEEAVAGMVGGRQQEEMMVSFAEMKFQQSTDPPSGEKVSFLV